METNEIDGPVSARCTALENVAFDRNVSRIVGNFDFWFEAV